MRNAFILLLAFSIVTVWGCGGSDGGGGTADLAGTWSSQNALAPGTFTMTTSLSPGAGEARVRIINMDASETSVNGTAASGSLTITSVDADRVVGSYQINSFDGKTGSASGIFDIPTGIVTVTSP